jgi:hypothetical protein
VKANNLEIHRTAEVLSADDLLALFRGQVLAIRIADFCPPEVCRTMTERLVNHHRLAFYPHHPVIGRVMTAFLEGHSDAEVRKRYYDEVPQMAREVRLLSWPYLNPLEHLRLILEDVWPSGAMRENVHGRPMAFGHAQLFKEGACARPHQDSLRMEEPDNERAQTLTTQLTALVYVQPAVAGGKLKLWAEHYNHEEFMARKNADFGLDYEKIPPPSVVIEPGLGELVMADSTKVHAVTTIESGLRVAVSSFIGFREISEPLTYWS